MTYGRLLEIAAHWAAILTAAVAVFAYGRYLWEQRQKRLRLEQHLKEENGLASYHEGQTVLELVANLGMTEREILDAAFRSKRIRRRVAVDDQGRAKTLLLEYDDEQ